MAPSLAQSAGNWGGCSTDSVLPCRYKKRVHRFTAAADFPLAPPHCLPQHLRTTPHGIRFIDHVRTNEPAPIDHAMTEPGPVRFQASLHGLRGLAVLYVVASHVGNAGFSLLPLPMDAIGKVGVWIFFSLSAYLLTSRLADRVSKGSISGEILSYAAHRIFRIYPLYLCVLLIHFALGDMSLQVMGLHVLLADGGAGRAVGNSNRVSVLPFHPGAGVAATTGGSGTRADRCRRVDCLHAGLSERSHRQRDSGPPQGRSFPDGKCNRVVRTATRPHRTPRSFRNDRTDRF